MVVGKFFEEYSKALESRKGIRLSPRSIHYFFKKHGITEEHVRTMKGLNSWVVAMLCDKPFEHIQDVLGRVTELENKVSSLEQRLSDLENGFRQSEVAKENKALKLQVKRLEENQHSERKNIEKAFKKALKHYANNPADMYAAAGLEAVKSVKEVYDSQDYDRCYKEANPD